MRKKKEWSHSAYDMEQMTAVGTWKTLENPVACVPSCSIDGWENWAIYPLIAIHNGLRAASRDITHLMHSTCPMYPKQSYNGQRKPSGNKPQKATMKAVRNSESQEKWVGH